MATCMNSAYLGRHPNEKIEKLKHLIYREYFSSCGMNYWTLELQFNNEACENQSISSV